MKQSTILLFITCVLLGILIRDLIKEIKKGNHGK